MINDYILLIAPAIFAAVLVSSLYYYHLWDIKQDEKKEAQKKSNNPS
jgi:hypothetical protein